jgi:hypothetical protein
MQAVTYSNEKLVNLLESTLNPTLRKQAEDELSAVHNAPGFSTTLLQLIMSDQIQMPVRQAGAIYLKNMINQFWPERKAEKPNEILPFSMHETDKQTIRDNLIEAVIHSPDPIR